MKIGAAILAGGRSLRMGQDKAELILNGETFVSRIAEQLTDFDEVLVIVDKPERCGELALPHIVDEYSLCGPMGGIHAALKAAKSDALFVVSCDIPLYKRELGEYLCSLLGDYDAVVPVSAEGKINPLCAVYRKSCEPVFEKHLAEGKLKILPVYDLLKVNYVNLSAEQSEYLRNINTPQEYEALIKEERNP